ncbi:hypothetical protein [Nocardia farcinica]|uniref:hypothetical protein n=1 Tax=Nocardia farcinica TaxID=37329 RepID=UPI0018941408|nr:hypothetical protein [Nocardia farcinica]MBF6411024.1 hypothetical protein [Nocardia farcinica]
MTWVGKRPARINATQLRLATYLDVPAIAAVIPDDFGDTLNLPRLDGVCDVWAGFVVETLLWAHESGIEAEFTSESVAADRAAAHPNGGDGGIDLQEAASYRRRIGLADSSGRRHRAGAYLAVTQGDPDQLAAAAFVFGSVGVGLRLPEYAVDEHGPWTVQQGLPPLAGATYVPVVGRRDGNFLAVFRGRTQEITPGFYRRYCDEAIVFLSEEFMTAPTPPPGFDRAQLLIDLNAFTRR